MPSRISSLIDSDSEDDNPPACTFGRSSDEEEPVKENQTNLAAKDGKPEKQKRSVIIRQVLKLVLNADYARLMSLDEYFRYYSLVLVKQVWE